ncbi:MAG: molybdopterin-dependent oxidoreductase [Cytophagaceae bacterium]|nr:molybdopterin-dependent oxidoreductase [Cytophagaceae bacterium]
MKYLFVTLLLISPGVFAQSKTLEVKGLVEKTMTLTSEQLGQMPVQEGRDFKVVSTSGEVRRTLDTYRGVRLSDVLKQAVIQMPSQKDKGKYYVVAKATDGYTAIFSHNDLFNNPTGEGVLVLFEENGRPIVESGSFVLISTSDKITGARHVKWLQSIEVRKVD